MNYCIDIILCDVLNQQQDIIAQVDRVTLYSLVSVVEAMVAAGVSDPYEFYEYVHVSEVRSHKALTCIGELTLAKDRKYNRLGNGRRLSD